MKKSILIALVAIVASLNLNCGLDESDKTANTCGNQCCTDTDCASGQSCVDGACVANDPVTPPAVETLPAPFRSPAACIFDFSSYYVSGAICGELRGTLRGTTNVAWTSGPYVYDADKDGYLGMSFTDAPDAGTYDISYVGFQNCSGKTPNDAWAQYGSSDMLKKMTPEARSYVYCNWYDAINGKTVDVGNNPACNLRITIDANCVISPAGNMANYK